MAAEVCSGPPSCPMAPPQGSGPSRARSATRPRRPNSCHSDKGQPSASASPIGLRDQPTWSIRDGCQATSFPRHGPRTHLPRRRRARRGGEGHARTARAHGDPRTGVRLAADRQLRRAGGQVDRAGGPLREHGRATDARSGGAHQRDGRRRHHHRHRAGARDDPRGPALPGRRHEPDGPEARHRTGGGGGGRRAQAGGQAVRHRPGDRPRGGDLGQQRPLDRRPARQRDRQGRPRGRDLDRGRLGPGERARGGRGPAVRPRLPVAVLHQQRRAADRGARGCRDPADRQEAVVAEGAAAAARGGGQGRRGRCW